MDPAIGKRTIPQRSEALDDPIIQIRRYAWKSRINAGNLNGIVTEVSAFGFSNGYRNPVSGAEAIPKGEKRMRNIVTRALDGFRRFWRRFFGEKEDGGGHPRKIHKRIAFWIGKYKESKGVGMTMEVSSEDKVSAEAESN